MGRRLLSLSEVTVSQEEYDWIRHAAKLSDMSVREYVRRSINLALRKQGVDAVLLAERERAARFTGPLEPRIDQVDSDKWFSRS